MRVWLVTAEAIYDHGCFGVFSTAEAALRHAESLWAGSDGHHALRIEPFDVDVARFDGDEILSLGEGDYDEKRRRLAEERNGGPRIRLVDPEAARTSRQPDHRLITNLEGDE